MKNWLSLKGRRLLLPLLFCMFAGVNSSSAASFRDRPIVWIVHYSPGGGFDVVSRAIARAMQKDLGVPLVVKNVTGAGGRTVAMARHLWRAFFY